MSRKLASGWRLNSRGCLKGWNLTLPKLFNAAIERPASFRVVDKDLRRVLLRNFRYQVVFEVHNDLLLFFGVLHCSRSFRKWRKARLSHEDE